MKYKPIKHSEGRILKNIGFYNPQNDYTMFTNNPNTTSLKARVKQPKSNVDIAVQSKKYSEIPLVLGFHERNKIGLDKAYKAKNKTYVEGNTMYIAGTDPSDPRDIWDDLKIPVNLTRYSHRYEQAEKALEENQNVTKLVGHSLGQAVAEALQKKKYSSDNKLDVVGYGGPVLQMGGQKQMRFRHEGDPISMLDSGALSIGKSWNPLKAHDYGNYSDKIPENDPVQPAREKPTVQLTPTVQQTPPMGLNTMDGGGIQTFKIYGVAGYQMNYPSPKIF